MEDVSKFGAFALLGEADPVPQSLFASHPEQAKTLLLLYEVSRELTSILDREELLRRVAQRIKKIVNYHVFSVMLWNEQTQLLESAFAMCYEDSIKAAVKWLGFDWGAHLYHASDYFDRLYEFARHLIKADLAYVDSS